MVDSASAVPVVKVVEGVVVDIPSVSYDADRQRSGHIAQIPISPKGRIGIPQVRVEEELVRRPVDVYEQILREGKISSAECGVVPHELDALRVLVSIDPRGEHTVRTLPSDGFHSCSPLIYDVARFVGVPRIPRYFPSQHVSHVSS